MSDITPFQIETPEAELADLKTRLSLVRWPDKETPDDWSQGIPLGYMKDIQQYWLNEYDWPARQALLNQWDGYKTEIDGLDIHFLHVKSANDNARPLLVTHGWPGSIIEFQKIIGPLLHSLNCNGLIACAGNKNTGRLSGILLNLQPRTIRQPIIY